MTSQMWMILITVVYVCAMMLLSWIIGKKTTKDETEFMVGGREFTAFMTAIGNGSILILAVLGRLLADIRRPDAHRVV